MEKEKEKEIEKEIEKEKETPIHQFKVTIIGDNGIGKTTFVNRHIQGKYEKTYKATVGAELLPLSFSTSAGIVILNVWDIAGGEKIGGFRDAFYLNSNAAIIMFDLTRTQTYNNVEGWYKDINRVCENIPVVLLGNKCDCLVRKIKTEQIVFHQKKNIPYYDVSAKANHNFNEAFLSVIRTLLNDDSIHFTIPPKLHTPTVVVKK
ncbi:gtp-binding nuclear protein ran [Anaeramoeba flamelloides]|uniref:GTP-binding nuclear protein n=1 Tax=Anaeramoeba flamelloides TaxID=1746091 RepID=A0ABQ8Y6R5_9EUKA|nr:gtp-binding nuclear protein ran [Anaeramoeba flamelloides]